VFTIVFAEVTVRAISRSPYQRSQCATVGVDPLGRNRSLIANFVACHRAELGDAKELLGSRIRFTDGRWKFKWLCTWTFRSASALLRAQVNVFIENVRGIGFAALTVVEACSETVSVAMKKSSLVAK
jgi:hypothetical protein